MNRDPKEDFVLNPRIRVCAVRVQRVLIEQRMRSGVVLVNNESGQLVEFKAKVTKWVQLAASCRFKGSNFENWVGVETGHGAINWSRDQ